MDLHWRNTQKPARFFALDARAFTFIFLFLVHVRIWTLVVAVTMMLLFWGFERRGLTFEAALRAMRVWMLGSRRPALRGGQPRRWTDFG
ncbi:MAG: IcmT/TraK family protein [Alphaproteobacteria bacterium]|nr:IcmT/TraK family protein [Alphaproteobacteria bacterium]